MKAINTKYFGPTSRRSSGIKAHDYDGNSVTISYPHEYSGAAAYAKAAVALCVKMGWTGELVAGGTKEGDHVFCFSASDRFQIPKKGE